MRPGRRPDSNMPGGPHREARTSTKIVQATLTHKSPGRAEVHPCLRDTVWLLKNGPVGLHSSGTLALEIKQNSSFIHVKASVSKSQGDSPNQTWTREKNKRNPYPFFQCVFLPAGLGAIDLRQASVVSALLTRKFLLI